MTHFDDGSGAAAPPKMTSSARHALNPKTETALLDYAIEIGRVQVKNREIAEERRAKAEARTALQPALATLPAPLVAVSLAGCEDALGIERDHSAVMPSPAANAIGAKKVATKILNGKISPPFAAVEYVRRGYELAEKFDAPKPVAEPERRARRMSAAIASVIALRDYTVWHEHEHADAEAFREIVHLALRYIIQHFALAPDDGLVALHEGWKAPWRHPYAPRNVRPAPHVLYEKLNDRTARTIHPLHAFAELAGLAEEYATNPATFIFQPDAGGKLLDAEADAERAIVEAKAAAEQAERDRGAELVRTSGAESGVIVLSKPNGRNRTFRLMSKQWPWRVRAGWFERPFQESACAVHDSNEQIELPRALLEQGARTPIDPELLAHYLVPQAKSDAGLVDNAGSVTPITDFIDTRSGTSVLRARKAVFKKIIAGPCAMAFGAANEHHPVTPHVRNILICAGVRGLRLLPAIVADMLFVAHGKTCSWAANIQDRNRDGVIAARGVGAFGAADSLVEK